MLKIMGQAAATVTQMQTYIKKVNPKVPDSVIKMIPLYISEGAVEGVRGDIAFAQSCLETGNFTFSGSAVTLDQNNFCGMGVIKNGVKGNSFKTPQLGIRVQVQHLQAYGSTGRLKQTVVDPRYTYVTRGCAEYVEYLGIQENPQHYGWAAGKDYGKKIITILNSILTMNSGTSTSGKENTVKVNIKKMISKKNCYIGQNKPAYVVIHETDNWSKGANARAHALAMKNGNLAGTVHYYVDSSEIYQTLDHSDGAWAVGDGKGKYGITNRNSINIEICVNPETDYYKAVDKAEQLAAYLLKQYGWSTDHLKRHYDASRKHCPRRILDEGLWPGFVKKTAAYMNGTASAATKPSTSTKPSTATSKGAGYMFEPKLVKLGSEGTSVLLLQEIFIARGCKGQNGKALSLSRKADENTIYALKQYQKSRNGVLSVDGIAGKNTWEDLIAI